MNATLVKISMAEMSVLPYKSDDHSQSLFLARSYFAFGTYCNLFLNFIDNVSFLLFTFSLTLGFWRIKFIDKYLYLALPFKEVSFRSCFCNSLFRCKCGDYVSHVKETEKEWKEKGYN